MEVPRYSVETMQIHPFDYASGVSANFLNSAHPILNQATLDSTQKQLEEIRAAPKDTLVIALISGGGSALFEATDANGQGAKLTLADLQLVNRLLLESGASIGDINIVRKHLSQVKGGHLARHCLLVCR
jgi:hydroxypyruvate reductase